jgi:predicted Zn finger-like uncharacterized protein
MSAVNDEDLRYTFSCPSCGGSFSISLAKIPPVQARFSCPKCSKAMDFPSRDEARVFIQLGAAGGEPAATPPPAPAVRSAPPPAERPAPPPAERPAPSPAAAAPAPEPPPPPPAPAPPERPAAPARPATPPPAATEPLEATGKTYVVAKKGFEGDEFDRRAMRQLIRTGAINENDTVSVGGAAGTRADGIPELKSLFELRKTARAVPPPVCPKHTDRLAHFRCNDTGRPLCEECAEEKKFGGTSLLVCTHCGGTAGELHAAPGDI